MKGFIKGFNGTKQNQKAKKQNLTDNVWFGAQRCFSWYSLSLFLFFCFEMQKPKQHVCFWICVSYGSKEG